MGMCTGREGKRKELSEASPAGVFVCTYTCGASRGKKKRHLHDSFPFLLPVPTNPEVFFFSHQGGGPRLTISRQIPSPRSLVLSNSLCLYPIQRVRVQLAIQIYTPERERNERKEREKDTTEKERRRETSLSYLCCFVLFEDVSRLSSSSGISLRLIQNEAAPPSLHRKKESPAVRTHVGKVTEKEIDLAAETKRKKRHSLIPVFVVPLSLTRLLLFISFS